MALILGCADWCGSLLVSLIMAIGRLALLRVFSEFSIVSHMTLMIEQAPAQHGKVMTLGFTGGVLGGTISSFTGPPAYAAYGVWGLGPVATGVLVITLFVIVR